MSQSVRILKNSAFLALAKGVNTAFVLLYLPFLAHYLGKENFGHYTFTYSFVGMFQVLAWLGIHRIVVREVARSHEQISRYYCNALSVKLLLSLITMIILAVTTYLLQGVDSLARQIILIAGAEMLIRTFGTINVSVFRALERMQNELLLTIVDSGTSAIGVFIAIILDLGLTGVMVAFLCGALAYTIVGFLMISRVVQKPTLRRDLSSWWFLLKEGLPIGVSAGVRQVYNRQGTVHLRSLGDVGQVGIYGGGIRIYNLTTIVPTALASALFPMLSRRAIDSREQLTATIETALKFFVLTAGAAAITLFLVAQVLVPFLLGEELAEVTLVIRWLSPAIVFAFGGSLFCIVLESVNRQQLNTIAWAIVLGLNLGLNIILVPRIGYIGSTLAFLTTEIVFALLTFFFVWKKVGRFAIYNPVVKPLAATLVCWILGWLLWQKLGLITLLIIMPLYALIIWKSKIFTKGEIDRLKHLFQQRFLSKTR